MARPTKLTPELHAEIVQAVRAGNFLETAAALVGITRVTVRMWIKRGAVAKGGKDRIFAAFSSAIKKARAEADVRDLETIRKASLGEKDAAGNYILTPAWTAAAWRLQHRCPHLFGDRSADIKALTKQLGKVTAQNAVLIAALRGSRAEHRPDPPADAQGGETVAETSEGGDRPS